tara:strand:+ start:558 stop:704 length:147 start_codon:yes stop_codon:yes gene_type:complete
MNTARETTQRGKPKGFRGVTWKKKKQARKGWFKFKQWIKRLWSFLRKY